MSRLVVRGELVGTEGRFTFGGPEKDIWSLRVDEVLLGEADADVLRVAHFTTEAIEAGGLENQKTWKVGDVGIFFLTHQFGSGILDDLYVATTGSGGVIYDNLDHWGSHLPRAEGVLGSMSILSPPSLTPFLHAEQTELVVDARVDEVGSPQEVLDWSYRNVTLSVERVVWSEWANSGEGSPPPPSEELTLVVSAPTAQSLHVGEDLRVMVRLATLPDPVGATWVLAGGAEGIVDSDIPPDEVAAEIDSLLSQQDDWVLSSRSYALAELRPIAAEAGRIPLISDLPPQPAAIDYGDLYNSPLVIVQDDLTITFDKWFFALLDGTARVAVTGADGSLLAEGPAEGPDSIMLQEEDGSFQILDSEGSVVAALSLEELSTAASSASSEYERLAAGS
ncbi:MAG: hypothetical protein L0Z47_07125 [Actinobacteria bacterium]|nr:hypothetical protein [Actinomycetota bacterium]